MAALPVLPVLSGSGWSFRAKSERFARKITDGKIIYRVESGTAAIALALKQSGIGVDHNVLIPAYGCLSLREAVLVGGSEFRAFRIHPDLSYDMSDIESKVDDQTRAILVPHYFGFPQELEELKDFCVNRNVILIEDCAHCFLTGRNDKKIGLQGNYSICSSTKFFPVVDGGVLIDDTGNIDSPELINPSLRFQVKVFANILEISSMHGRLGWPGRILKALFSLVSNARSGNNTAPAVPIISENTFENIDAVNFGQKISLASKVIEHFYSADFAMKCRRINFNYMLERLAHLKHAHPLFQDIDDDVVPYMFPLVLHSPRHQFPGLKKRGIPMFRWEQSVLNECEVADEYAFSVVQLPCHEQLRMPEIDWMLSQIEEELAVEL